RSYGRQFVAPALRPLQTAAFAAGTTRAARPAHCAAVNLKLDRRWSCAAGPDRVGRRHVTWRRYLAAIDRRWAQCLAKRKTIRPVSSDGSGGLWTSRQRRDPCRRKAADSAGAERRSRKRSADWGPRQRHLAR